MTDVDHREIMERAHRVMARANDVMERIDQRGGVAQQAARRERQRLNAGLGRTLATAGAIVVLIWFAAIIVGLVVPIGISGFTAALAASVVAAAVLIFRGGRRAIEVPAPAADMPNGPMVERFDSYIYRVRPSLPVPAQAEIDSISAILPSLKQVLERVDTLDPRAQDARRLMALHLPDLIDRYRNVPTTYRGERDGEGKTVDDRLVESLGAARTALNDVSQQLARQDLAAFETQGRFIKSRYGEEPDVVGPASAATDNQPTGDH